MGWITETTIRQEGGVYIVHEVLGGSEYASSVPIGEIRRGLPFGGWAFVGKEGCELTRADLAIIDRKLEALEQADRGKSPKQLLAERDQHSQDDDAPSSGLSRS